MTINELLAAAGLTGNDVIPMYDAEAAAGTEPTQKIKASDFAAAIKTLASLLGTGDVVNTLSSTSTTAPLSAAQGKVLDGKITALKTWETISGIIENQDAQIDNKYNEICVEGTFTNGQKLLFYLPMPGVRQDSGFYYTNNANGSGAVIFGGDHSFKIPHPYYAGQQTTYSSLRVWGK